MPRSSSSYGVSYSFGPGPLTTAVKYLIGANVAIFVLRAAIDVIAPAQRPHFLGLLALSPFEVTGEFRLWQLATYMFLHAGLFHILFNMLALWMFGVELERRWGTQNFLRFYFITGIGAGAL